MHYDLPLGEIVLDFFDQLKTRTRGYASLDYEFSRLPAERPGQARHPARRRARRRALADRAARARPPARQGAGRPSCARRSRASCSRCRSRRRSAPSVVARETVKAVRKDVTAKCYGGDISRKRKLLEKQKEGKKRMKQVGVVEVPQEAFLAVLELEPGDKDR